jgi:TolB-like protein
MDYLCPAERSRLHQLRLTEPLVSDTLSQVERILASRSFARVHQTAKDFLGFVVAKKLLGHADRIKETTIAICVFHESAEFDPLLSSKVRVAGSGLRRRIAAYYAKEGKQDLIEITIPAARYAPEIRDRRHLISVCTFENWHPNNNQHYLCSTFANEIAYLLNRAPVRAIRVTTCEVPREAAGYALRGSVEHRDNVVRLNVSLADFSKGRIVYWHSFEGCRDDLFRLTRGVADAISDVLKSQTECTLRASRK